MIVSVTKTYLTASVIGASLEVWTGYTGGMWLAMLVGAVFLRKHDPETPWRKRVPPAFTAVSLAWVFTNSVTEYWGLESDAYRIAAAGLIAAMSDYILDILSNPAKGLDLLNKLKGVRHD